MIKRLVIYSISADEAERGAATAADELGMFYLSLDSLVLYNGNRMHLKQLVAEGSYNRFFKQSLREASEFENTVIATASKDAVYVLSQSGAAVCEISQSGDKTLVLDMLNPDCVYFALESAKDIAAAIAAVDGGSNG